VTPPSAPGTAREARSTRWLLVVPYAIIVLVAFLTPTATLFPHQGDVNLYLEKASALVSGRIPYRDFPLEYPPLALVPMVVPYLLWPFGEITLDVYKWLFAGWEAVLIVGLGLVLAEIVRVRARSEGNEDAPMALPGRLRWLGVRVIILTLGAALALTWRFDLFPALLVMVAVWASLANQPALAGVAIAAGILAKLYPLALVPALAIPWLLPFDRDRLIRYGGAIGITVVAGLLPFVVLGGLGALTFVSQQALRGLQIESVGGALVLLDGLIRGEPVRIIAPFSAAEVSGPLASAWLGFLPIFTLLAFAALAWVGWRRMKAEVATFGSVAPSTVVAFATASLLVLIVTSKVFSIQYVVWLLPFAALLEGRRFWLAAVIVALTMPIHPLLYADVLEQEVLPILVLNLRNLLAVALTCWSIADLRPARVPRPPGTWAGAGAVA
jgi:hypothetical protein